MTKRAHRRIPDLTIEQAARFWSHVDMTGGRDACWPWTASTITNKCGNHYGRTGFDGANCLLAHRVAYALVKGDPLDLTVDHTCRSTLCCNPRHLDAVTGRENVRRWARTVIKCPHGHERTPANIITRMDRNGWEHHACRLCVNAESAARRRRNRAENRDARSTV